jgi:hypothetical protein
VITRFPADELLVAGRIYVRGADLEPSVDGNGALPAAVAAAAIVDA